MQSIYLPYVENEHKVTNGVKLLNVCGPHDPL